MKLSSTSSLLLLFASLFVGAAAIGGSSSSSIHLRGGRRDDLSSSSSSSQDIGIDTVDDIDDIVTLSSFVMIEVVDVPMNDLSFEDRADFNYAFQQAFDTVHGDHDGLYLSGEQIDGINNITDSDSDSSSSSIITARRRKSRWPKSKYYNNFDIYLHMDLSGRCGRHCKDDDVAMMDMEDETETETSSLLQLLLRNTNDNVQQLELQDTYSVSLSSSAKEEQDTTEYVFDESNLDEVADEFCRLLKDTDSSSGGNKRFENAKMCDIFILSETEYNTALTAIGASTATSTATSTAATDYVAPKEEEEEDTIPVDSESESDSSAISLPYFYGNTDNIKADIVGTGYLKITLNGIGMQRNRSLPKSCGVWHTNDLFDFGSSIHNAFNAIHGTTTDGVFDAGQTIDKIKCVHSEDEEQEKQQEHETTAAIDIDYHVDTIEDPAADSAAAIPLEYKRKSRWPKNSSHYKKWGDHFDIYLAMDLSGKCGRHCKDDDVAMMDMEDASSSSFSSDAIAAYFSEASLRDIADAASDDLIRFGNPHFRHLIDCTVEYLTPSEYYTQALYNNDEEDEEATTTDTSHADGDTSVIITADA